jgi:hypothetical protein
VRLLQAGEVLTAAFGVAVSLEIPKAAGALEALTEEVTGEAMVEVAVSLETPKAAGALEALTEEVTEEVAGEAMEEVTGKLKE